MLLAFPIIIVFNDEVKNESVINLQSLIFEFVLMIFSFVRNAIIVLLFILKSINTSSKHFSEFLIFISFTSMQVVLYII